MRSAGRDPMRTTVSSASGAKGGAWGRTARVWEVLGLAGVLLFAQGCSATGRGGGGPDVTAEAIPGTSATLVVHGMSCPLCANNVDKQVLALPGVDGVDIDMGSGEVRVRLDGSGRTTRAMLARAVDRSGFTLESIRVP